MNGRASAPGWSVPGALRALWFVGWLLVLLAACPAFAQDVQPVPTLTSRVIDNTGTLTADQRDTLEAKLEQFERARGSQIVVLMVRTTAPEDIASYAQRVADAWKIGRRDIGDGLLIVVARDDRRLRVEVAKALEGAVPDLAAKRIIDAVMTPAFRNGDYAGGLHAGIDHLAARIAGESLPLPGDRGSGAAPGTQWSDLVVFLLVGVPVFGAVMMGIFGRRFGAVATSALAGGLGWVLTASIVAAAGAATAALVLVLLSSIGGSPRRQARMTGRRGHHDTPVIWGGGGGGGWGSSGGSDGGGFSSGGGGDFGGGGASGDW